jgi:hypothetical protein
MVPALKLPEASRETIALAVTFLKKICMSSKIFCGWSWKFCL